MSLSVSGLSDLVIALSYFFIPIQISVCLNTTEKSVKVLAVVQITFVLFIICCGITHFLAFLYAHSDLSPIETLMKALTAVVSLCSTIVLQLFAREIRALVNKAALLEDTIQASEDRVDELIKENSELSQARSQILASISHEFRNPLQSILGYGELLKSSKLDSRQSLMVQDLIKCSNALLELVNDIVEISRITGENFSLKAEWFSPAEECEAALRLARVKTKQQVALRYNILTPVHASVKGDRLRFSQVLTNLISNSAKFTFAGSISVSLALASSPADLRRSLNENRISKGAALFRKESGEQPEEKSRLLPESSWLIVVVADTGIGISKEAQKKLFRHFSQAHSAEFGGSGLGLVVCKAIVEKMGGRLSFTSGEGKGSSFGFAIPLHESSTDYIPAKAWTVVRLQQETKAKGKQGVVPPSLNKLWRLLVVDDSSVNRSIVVRFLEQLGFSSIETAANGEEAVTVCLDSRIDCVFMDTQMPVMDGNQACAKIKSFAPGTLVLAYTGSPELLQEQLNMYDGVLPKPCLKPDLARALCRVQAKGRLRSPV